jgi:uncharacterized surface protein with fasciclin (FAS1) repeats
MKLFASVLGASVLGAAAYAAGGDWGSCSGADARTASNDKASSCCPAGEQMAGSTDAIVIAADHHKGDMSGKTIVDIAAGDSRFSTLVAAVKAAGLADTLSGDGPFTVFAPTNAAFNKLPSGTVETLLKPESRDKLQSILTYHVVSGNVMAEDVVGLREATTVQGQRIDIGVERDSAGNVASVDVDNANVIATDITASNGVIHVIDSVILPEQRNAVEVADEAGSFRTLIAAAKAAGLAETLATEGPLTILAPTDEAFGKLPDGTVQSLLRPENHDRLATILKYHVIEGRVYDDQAVKADSVKTLAGETVTVNIIDGRLTFNDSTVVKSDIEASNAVIHVIDEVLIPE